MEGLAARNAAERHAADAARDGPALFARGRDAVRRGDAAKMIAADIAFHAFVYRLSDNPLIAEAMAPQWAWMQRVIGEVLAHDEQPRDIWDQHEAIVQAVAAGDAIQAETLARRHIAQAAEYMLARLGRAGGGASTSAQRQGEDRARPAPSP
jgi:DNA-binding GntR family transcriptional regulator